jgi:hypothetical protein
LLISPVVAVGAVGVPVKEGEAIVALNAILFGSVAIVVELTPPTLFTVGRSAVPPKSFANLIFPLTVVVASGAAAALTPELTLD